MTPISLFSLLFPIIDMNIKCMSFVALQSSLTGEAAHETRDERSVKKPCATNHARLLKHPIHERTRYFRPVLMTTPSDHLIRKQL